MSELDPESPHKSGESYTQAPEVAPGQADIPTFGPDADAAELDRAAAARQRAREVISGIMNQNASPPSAEAARSPEPAPRERDFIVAPEPMPNRPDMVDPLESVRVAANDLLGRMIQDPQFAKELTHKKGIGEDYSPQGIAESMASAAWPHTRRAMKAAGRGGRYERSDSYLAAGSDVANAIGRSMDLENHKQRTRASGAAIIQEPNGADQLVDVKQRKRPINYLKNRRLTDRLGIHLPALRLFR